MRILLIDDDVMILKGLCSMILSEKDLSATVTCAEGGEEALELFETTNNDIAIVDISMPRINGLEVIAEAQRRGLCKRFIILSAYNKFEYAQQAIRYKVIDYLIKPVCRDDLINMLRNISEEISGYKEDRLKLSEEATRKLLPPLPNPKQVSETVKNILRYLANNYAKNISLQDAAKLVYMHPNYVSKLFKKEMGISFIKYLNLLRIQMLAEKLLIDRNSKLKSIAEGSGFISERQFFKVFKLYSGMTPIEFRIKGLELVDRNE